MIQGKDWLEKTRHCVEKASFSMMSERWIASNGGWSFFSWARSSKFMVAAWFRFNGCQIRNRVYEISVFPPFGVMLLLEFYSLLDTDVFFIVIHSTSSQCFPFRLRSCCFLESPNNILVWWLNRIEHINLSFKGWVNSHIRSSLILVKKRKINFTRLCILD